MSTTTAADIRPGDVILPPERELRLWMRRTCKERGLDESALNLTVLEVGEGAPDKGGRWIRVRANFSPEWNANKERPYPFIFKARPTTPWPILSRAVPA